jgi:hypothetical protein
LLFPLGSPPQNSEISSSFYGSPSAKNSFAERGKAYNSIYT